MTTYIPSLTIPAFILSQPAASILLPVALGTGIGYSVSPSATRKTYNELKQPPFSLPGYASGPVWTCLYASMGYAAYRAWTIGMNSVNPTTRFAAQHGATLYTVQLGLNLAWMPLFFGLGRPIEATTDIVALTGTVGYLIYTWNKVDAVAAWLLVPYLGWLSFATYLSFGAGYLNGWDFRAAQKAVKEE